MSQTRARKASKARPHARASASGSSQETRERLLEAASRLFAARGYDGVSVQELARGAGVNVSLVSYHFGGKEGLYRSCLEQFGKARLAAAERILRKPESAEEFRVRLRMFIEEFFNCNLEASEVSRIIQRECDLELPLAVDVFKNTFLKVFETAATFFKGAQSAGLVRKELDPLLVAAIFFGSLKHFVQSQRIGEKFFGLSIQDPKYREKAIEHLVQTCIHGCAPSERLT